MAMRQMTEEEKQARLALLRRMEIEQSLKDQHIKDDVERCPHGRPLSRSCPKCDCVTPDQIQSSEVIYHYEGDK